ncbi:unnamed protein product [Schistosoma margrebowiei]|uniref:Uncharacterized protein n=1 Tax=Schistosoma margrebowiei TaxID=48269 RepID=A0A183MZF2_9TREM|nr:unnamed protein product [Schistosoma margrebowiei]
MWVTGRTSPIATEMRYNLEVLGCSETQSTQTRQKRIGLKMMLLYSGHKEANAPHTQGVTLMLSKERRNELIGWESHRSSIIGASFKTNEGITINVIQCYSLNNDSNNDDKDQFYERLQSIIVKCLRNDMIIRMRDLNSNVGMNNTRYEDVMERGTKTRRDLQTYVHTTN